MSTLELGRISNIAKEVFKILNGLSGRPKAALLIWFLMVDLLFICLLSASIVATCIAAHFAHCRAL